MEDRAISHCTFGKRTDTHLHSISGNAAKKSLTYVSFSQSLGSTLTIHWFHARTYAGPSSATQHLTGSDRTLLRFKAFH